MIGRRPSRAPGRHRAGPTSTVRRRLWDGPARAEAERLDQAWPDWTVLYGAHSRLFYAIAAWPTPEPVIVQASTPKGLEAHMYEAVMAMTARREAPAPDMGALTSPKQARRLSRFPGASRRAAVPTTARPGRPYRSVS